MKTSDPRAQRIKAVFELLKENRSGISASSDVPDMKKNGKSEKSDIRDDSPLFADVVIAPENGDGEKSAPVPPRGAYAQKPPESAERAVIRREFGDSRILKSAVITPGVSYSLRDAGFLAAAKAADSYAAERFSSLPESEHDIASVSSSLYAPLYSIMPVFRDLTPSQKTWYGFWKRCVAAGKGNLLPSDTSYVSLFASETANFCEAGVISGEEAVRRFLLMISLSPEDPSRSAGPVRRFLLDCVFDACVSKGIPFPLDALSGMICEPNMRSRPLLLSVYTADKLLRYREEADSLTDEKRGDVMALVSDYDYRASKAYGRDPEFAMLAADAMRRIGFPAVMAEFASFASGKTPPCSLLTVTRRLYPGTVTDPSLTAMIQISYYPVFTESSFGAAAASIIKYTENKVRTLCGVKNKLSGVGASVKQQVMIDGFFAPYDEARKKREAEKKLLRRSQRISADRTEEEAKPPVPRTVVLDPKKAEDIERDSWINTYNLTKDIDGSDEGPVITLGSGETKAGEVSGGEEAAAPSGMEGALSLLSESDRKVLAALSRGDKTRAERICREAGEFFLAVSGRINSAFSDAFGDVVIEGDGVVPDYAEELSELLRDD